MFDEFRKAYEDQPGVKTANKSRKQKRVIRFRWPIVFVRSSDRLARYFEPSTFVDKDEIKPKDKVYLTHAFVRDNEGREYKSATLRILEEYGFSKPK